MNLGIDFKEGSTWRGILWLIISTGISQFDADTLKWFLPSSLAIVGLMGLFVKDEPKSSANIDLTKDIQDVLEEGRSND